MKEESLKYHIKNCEFNREINLNYHIECLNSETDIKIKTLKEKYTKKICSDIYLLILINKENKESLYYLVGRVFNFNNFFSLFDFLSITPTKVIHKKKCVDWKNDCPKGKCDDI